MHEEVNDKTIALCVRTRGYYSPPDKEIVIREGMPQEQTMKTAIHELTHSLLHDKDTWKISGEEMQKDRMTIEIEAEGCAYVCLSHFGFEDVGDYSFPYMSTWSSGRDMKELHAALSTIQQTASQIIKGIETEMRQQILEQDVDRYEIYQIPTGSEAAKYKFMALEEVDNHFGKIAREHYAMVYTSPLKDGDSLDSLYEKFNTDLPADYTGHSLSVSDVIVLHQEHVDKAYYVDSIGFKEIPFPEKAQGVEKTQDAPGLAGKTERIADALPDNVGRQSERIADGIQAQGRKGSVLQSLRVKQRELDSNADLIQNEHRTDKKRGEQAL